MLHAFLLIAAMMAAAPTQDQTVEARNGEFVFSQYPPRAKAAGEQGSVRFRAEADAKGNVMSCKVTESSGFERLDRETCDMIIDHASFKPTLDSEGVARASTHDGIVNWRIPGVAPAGIKIAGKSPDEILCKRQTKTGSLVSHSRLCLTRRQWSEYAEQNQDRYGEIQGKFGSSREGQATFPSSLPGPGYLSGGYSGPPR